MMLLLLMKISFHLTDTGCPSSSIVSLVVRAILMKLKVYGVIPKTAKVIDDEYWSVGGITDITGSPRSLFIVPPGAS